MRRSLLLAVLGVMLATPAAAYKAGERHLIVVEDAAALRDAQGSPRLRVTVWYPASGEANEVALDMGTPEPLFVPGTAAPDAAFADDKQRPAILFSHGFGGTARIMAWFGTALARAGYIVIAVDHPGNNGMDAKTMAGAALFWERAGDLAVAWESVTSSPIFAAHVNRGAFGTAGFSAGGFTALAAAGGRVDLPRFRAFCDTHPDDGVCQPQREFPISQAEARSFFSRPEMASELARAGADFGISGVKAVFMMAPALVQAFDPASLRELPVPVSIIVGDADKVAPPATNGLAAAAMMPGAAIRELEDVAHYDFGADCTAAGNAFIPVCPTKVPRAMTHAVAVTTALKFFEQAFGAIP